MWADPIAARYLLVINIPHYLDDDGTVSVEQLWEKDLQLHRSYLTDLRVASPRRFGRAPDPSRVLVDRPGMGRLTHCPMPDPTSALRSIWSMPSTLLRLWKAVGDSDVVHVGVGGWPYPLGWPAVLIAKIRKRFLLVVIESAPWRLGLLPGAPLKQKLIGRLFETMADWAINQADLSLFTQAEYRSSLLRSGRPGLVTNASWIDEDVILTDAAATRSWDEKPKSPLRLMFVGRVTATKGIDPMLEAIRSLARAGVHAEIDILGEGDRLDACKALSSELQGPTTIRILPQVPYGPAFFKTIANCHALLVPSLADEQPRIIYDAYSQAVPVIASNTAGIRDCVTDGQTGLLVPPGNPEALAAAITQGVKDLAMLRRLGMIGLQTTRKYTHAEMHRIRHSVLKDLLSPSPSMKKTTQLTPSP